MSVQEEINRINQNIANTYSAMGEMGATLPAEQNSDNIASTVRSIPQSGGSVSSFRVTAIANFTSETDGTLTDVSHSFTEIQEANNRGECITLDVDISQVSPNQIIRINLVSFIENVALLFGGTVNNGDAYCPFGVLMTSDEQTVVYFSENNLDFVVNGTATFADDNMAIGDIVIDKSVNEIVARTEAGQNVQINMLVGSAHICFKPSVVTVTGICFSSVLVIDEAKYVFSLYGEVANKDHPERWQSYTMPLDNENDSQSGVGDNSTFIVNAVGTLAANIETQVIMIDKITSVDKTVASIMDAARSGKTVRLCLDITSSLKEALGLPADFEADCFVYFDLTVLTSVSDVVFSAIVDFTGSGIPIATRINGKLNNEWSCISVPIIQKS